MKRWVRGSLLALSLTCGVTMPFAASAATNPGWVKANRHLYYYTSNGKYTGWLHLGNKTYNFNADGMMRTSPLYAGGKWYYFGTNGVLINSQKAKPTPPTTSKTTHTLASLSSHPIIRMGSTGSSVKELQRLLNSFSYGLVVDGIFGKLTNNGVRNFQGKNHLIVDGIVGHQTWGALLGVKPSLPNTKKLSTPAPTPVKPTPAPMPAPTPAPTPAPAPTPTPAPTPAPAPTPTPTPTPAPTPTPPELPKPTPTHIDQAIIDKAISDANTNGFTVELSTTEFNMYNIYKNNVYIGKFSSLYGGLSGNDQYSDLLELIALGLGFNATPEELKSLVNQFQHPNGVLIQGSNPSIRSGYDPGDGFNSLDILWDLTPSNPTAETTKAISDIRLSGAIAKPSVSGFYNIYKNNEYIGTFDPRMMTSYVIGNRQYANLLETIALDLDPMLPEGLNNFVGQVMNGSLNQNGVLGKSKVSYDGYTLRIDFGTTTP